MEKSCQPCHLRHKWNISFVKGWENGKWVGSGVYGGKISPFPVAGVMSQELVLDIFNLIIKR